MDDETTILMLIILFYKFVNFFLIFLNLSEVSGEWHGVREE